MSESNLDNEEKLKEKILNQEIIEPEILDNELADQEIKSEEVLKAEAELQNDENEDIEFDDNIDIDALQAQLQQHMSEGGIEYVPDSASEQAVVLDGSNAIEPIENFKDNVDREDNPSELESFMNALSNTGFDNPDAEDKSHEQNNTELPLLFAQEEDKPRLQLGEKKYIIYIEPDNVDFIEAMTINERKKVINRLLKEEDTTLKKRKIMHERAKFINQVIIMVVTVVVSLPIFFVLLNKSIEVTILNYQQSQQNFVKLYKEQGKIKSYKKFQKTFD